MGQDDFLTDKSGGGLQAWLDPGAFVGYELVTNGRNQSSLFKGKRAYWILTCGSQKLWEEWSIWLGGSETRSDIQIAVQSCSRASTAILALGTLKWSPGLRTGAPHFEAIGKLCVPVAYTNKDLNGDFSRLQGHVVHLTGWAWSTSCILAARDSGNMFLTSYVKRYETIRWEVLWHGRKYKGALGQRTMKATTTMSSTMANTFQWFLLCLAVF